MMILRGIGFGVAAFFLYQALKQSGGLSGARTGRRGRLLITSSLCARLTDYSCPCPTFDRAAGTNGRRRVG